MFETTDFGVACREFMRRKDGCFFTKDGSVICGSLLNIESGYDSGSGVACIDVLTAQETCASVYEDDFVRAMFPDTGGADDAGK